MEFDWNNPPFNLDSSLTLREIEESFEDPFALRVLPDSPRFSVQARFFNLGMSAGGIGIFSVYRKNASFISGKWTRTWPNAPVSNGLPGLTCGVAPTVSRLYRGLAIRLAPLE